MKATQLVYGVSAAIHVGIGAALQLVHVKPPAEVVPIELTTIEQKKEEKEPEPEPEPIPEPAPPKPSARPKSAPDPVPVAAPPTFGFVMGASTGPGGIAVPTEPKVVRQTTRSLTQAEKKPEAGCATGQTKAKALSMPRPAYTDAARAAAIEGKVRVQLTIDATGAVTDVKVVEGLGSGLDEAAVEALKGAKFAPATECGKPVASTFVVNVRFAL
jgi:protein TonB